MVLAGWFWLQSMSTLPRRRDLRMLDTTRSGWPSSRRRPCRGPSADLVPARPARSSGRRAGGPSTHWSSARRPGPAAPSSSAIRAATRQHSTMVVPSPGSRSNTMWSGGAGSVRRRPTRHSGTWNSMVARLAAHTSGGQVADHAVVDARRPSLGRGHRHACRTQSGACDGPVLLEERLAFDAVGKPLHGERAVPDVGEHHRCDPGVVVDQLALGEPRCGEEDLVQIGDVSSPAVDAGRDRAASVRTHGRTSAGATCRAAARARPGGATGRRGVHSREADLADQRGPHPAGHRCPPRSAGARRTGWSRGRAARVGPAGRPWPTGVEPGAHLARRSGARLPSSGSGRPRSSAPNGCRRLPWPGGPAPDHHLLGALALDLDPVAAPRPRPVAAVAPLGHDALHPELGGERHTSGPGLVDEGGGDRPPRAGEPECLERAAGARRRGGRAATRR